MLALILDRGYDDISIQDVTDHANLGRQGAMRARIEQVLYELDTYRASGDPNGHSVTMRMEFQRVGLGIAKEHWLTGAGTGDTQLAFDAAYAAEQSPLAGKWRLRAHNQYLTLLISFGVFGLLWSLFSWWWPAWRHLRRRARAG